MPESCSNTSEGSRKRLLVSIPCQPDGAVNIHLAAWLQRLRVPGWTVRVDYLQAKPVAFTRNMQCRDFLKSDCDYAMFIDDDAVPDDEGLGFLLAAIQRTDVDAVGGWSVMKSTEGPVPCVQQYHPDKPATPHMRILSQKPNLYEIEDGGIGAHCLMVKRATIQTFFDSKRIWFKDTMRDGSLERPQLEEIVAEHRDNKEMAWEEINRWLTERDDFNMDHVGGRIQGQDVWFCCQMHSLGLRLWVDTRVLWGHIKNSDIRIEFVETLRLQQQVTALEERYGRTGS